MSPPLVEQQEPWQPTRYADSSIAPHLRSRAAELEFGRFRVLLRRRQLLADDVPVEIGTRAFDLLLVLLEADGSLITKDELLRRVWPGIVVAEENLKVQISALRKALSESRDLIRTEFGRGYRFTAAVRSIAPPNACPRAQHKHRPGRKAARRQTLRRSAHGWWVSSQVR
jgi:DNA-binding winged helix-turn-helix (wHTH) protein